MKIIENCVVCGKYLDSVALQEQGMCNSCDDITDDIANSFKEDK